MYAYCAPLSYLSVGIIDTNGNIFYTASHGISATGTPAIFRPSEFLLSPTRERMDGRLFCLINLGHGQVQTKKILLKLVSMGEFN